MAPRYKLTYFDAIGRAEAIRYLFAHIDVPYEDFRIKTEDWVKLKEATPSGTLPTLEVDGKIICQTNAILGYLGKIYNLCGKDDLETARCNEIVGTVEDLCMNIRCDELNPFLQGKGITEEQKKAKIEELAKKLIGPYLVRMEKFYNESPSCYFVGNSITFADFCVFNSLSYLKHPFYFFSKCLDLHPKLLAFCKTMEELPGIKKHIAKRPKTQW